jgi:hypothetical protein
MTHGGTREGAGRKSTWSTPGPTKIIRIPEALADRVLAFARELDAQIGEQPTNQPSRQ